MCACTVNTVHIYWNRNMRNCNSCQYTTKWPSEISEMSSAYNVSLQSPPPFNFSSPDEWPKWRDTLNSFKKCPDCARKMKKDKLATLLNCLGKDADDVLTFTNVCGDNRKKYAKVLGKFDSHFKIHYLSVLISTPECKLRENPLNNTSLVPII